MQVANNAIESSFKLLMIHAFCSSAQMLFILDCVDFWQVSVDLK